ncbi:MAG: aminotransferase class IV [Pseudomonadota bacterium]|uniref:aminotransferase class IV n=1 Tax=Phenylobacterium sp. TaxID=1871053 RepID=UPI0025FA6262|nr:aminotransferase class IV [Phenylobacterium sp.]MBT9473295.1 aminotransferase class IV [Phenylobacterium sp.]
MTLGESVPLDDRGLLLGDGLFETVLAVEGELVGLAAHLDRMAGGCAVLGLPPLDADLAGRLMRSALARIAAPRAAVRLTLTAGSGGRGLDRPEAPAVRLLATAAPSAKPVGPACLITSSVRRNEGSPAARLKTLSYLDSVLARAEARGQGADEALMLNSRGQAACAAAANLFWVREGRLFTPALDCGVLAGTMRARVLAVAAGAGVEAVEVRETPTGAEAMFITNSLIGVRAVSTLDGTIFGPSALVERLAEAIG